MLTHVQTLGFRVNLEKSNLSPRQVVFFLGIRLDSCAMKASLKPGRVAKIQETLRPFHRGRRLEFLCFQRLLGLIAAAGMLVPLGLLRARPLQRWLNSFRFHPKRDRHKKLKVTRSCLRTLLPWRNKRLLMQGVPLGCIPFRRTLVSTDASRTGWGAVWEGRTVKGLWQTPWDTEHINVLELCAVYLALRALLPLIQGKHVLVRTDNTVAVCYINHQGGTRSLHCLKMAQKPHFWSLPRLASVRAIYIPGDLNQAADLLSSDKMQQKCA